MTIVRRGNKFRVISGKGKNLGDSDTKSGAVKRLREVEYFKHNKCIVDPELVKQQKYQPVVFQGKDKALGDKPEKDFPSTPMAYDLKDTAQPEFPSAPFSGQPYAQSFSNPSAGQGNDPDIQKKGSDFNNSYSTVIGDFASVQPADGGQEKNSTGRGRTLIQPASELKEGHVKQPIKRARSIRENSMSPTGFTGQTSDLSRSLRLKGTNLVFKQQLNDFNYPVDKGFDNKIDSDEELQKRKAVFHAEKIKQKQEEYNEHREKIANEKKFDSYLGRSKSSKPVGEYTKEYSGAKVTFDQPIDPTKKPKKVFTHLTPEGHKLHLQRQKKKDGSESLNLSVMYTQNQPLDPSLKPTMEVKDKKKTKKSLLYTAALASGDPQSIKDAKHIDYSRKLMGKDPAESKEEQGLEVPKNELKSPNPSSTPEIAASEDQQETEKSLAATSPVEVDLKHEIEKLDVEILRSAIIAELDAVNFYEQMASKTASERIREVLSDVIKEEKTHVGEFQSLLLEFDKVQKKELKEGEKEVGKSFSSQRVSPHFDPTKTRPNPIKGGIGDKLKPTDVDSSQLIAGINVEKEHVGKDDNKTEEEKKEISQDIALDHLKEDKNYYTKLNEMERHSKASKKEESKSKKLIRMGKNKVGKSVVHMEDFKQYLRNRGKMKGKPKEESQSGNFPKPYSVEEAESMGYGQPSAPVIDIKTRKKLNG